MPETPPQPNETRFPANTAGAVASALRIIAGLTNEKVLLMVVCGAFGFMMYAAYVNMKEDKAASNRQWENQLELTRQGCDARDKERAKEHALLVKDVSAAFAVVVKDINTTATAERKTRQQFETDEREKDRKILAVIGVEWGRWRDQVLPLLTKKPPEEINIFGVTIAPMPKVKEPPIPIVPE